MRGAALPLFFLSALAGASRSQEPAPQPVGAGAEEFPAQVERITVDVVVADQQGNPVTGLGRDDFTVLEEGQPRSIVSFDVIRPPAPTDSPDPAPLSRPRFASNVASPTERGRTFVVLFDDLHLSPLNAQRARAAVAEFLERGTGDGDRVLLVSTTGAGWWSAPVPEGRDDLLAILKRLEGRRIPDNALERLTDHEALRIFIYQDTLVAQRVRDRLERYSTKSREEMAVRGREDAEQVFARGTIDPYVQGRAQEAFFKLRARLDVTLTALGRALQSLGGTRDRKAVLLVSEGFVYDPTFEPFKRVSEAARRANAAVYFIDTRGLEALGSAYGAEFGAPLDERNLLAAIADVSLEGGGSAYLAEETGGFSVRRTNDFADGAARIGRESGTYYLLGYDPGDVPRDGRFRRIDVRVKAKDLTVRARRGYYAPSSPGAGAASRPDRTDAELQRALDAPAPVDSIPLRMTAYTLDESGAGRARVVLAADVDVSRVAFAEKDGQASAALDTIVVLAHRDSGEFFRDDQRADLARRAAAPAHGPVWYSFLRDFDVPPGGYQAKLVVRDVATRRVGSVVYQFEVPSLDRLRVSTPILSDVLQSSAGGGSTPALLVRRTFPSAGFLYCMFDVYGAARGPDGRPRVKAGHELRRSDGVSLGRAPARLIEPTSIGALVRLIQIPLAGLGPADYELRLSVQDEISGETREIVEPFTVAPAGLAAR